MAYPFRQPQNTEDQPEPAPQEEEKPRLATLIRKKHPGIYDDLKDDELEKAVIAKHPQYKDLMPPAQPEGLFNKTVEALKPAKSIKASNTVFAGKQSSEAKPGPDLEKRQDTNAVGFDQDKWTNIASKFPESWHGIPIRQPAAFLGSLAGTALETISAPENIAAMGAGALKGGASKALDELPIRQGREIPYRMEPPTVKDINLPAAKKVEEEVKPSEAVKPAKPNPFEKARQAKIAALQKEVIGEKPTEPSIKQSQSPSPDMVSVGGEKDYNASQIQPQATAELGKPRYSAEDLAIAKKESDRLIANPPSRAGASLPRGGGEIPKTADELDIEKSNKQFAESPDSSIEDSRTPGDYQLNDASKASPESLKNLNEFMDSALPKGEQSVEDIRNSLNADESIRQPRHFPGDEAIDISNTEEPSVRQTEQPLAKFSHNNPELGGRQYDVGEGSTVGEKEALKRGYKLPDSPTVEEAAAQQSKIPAGKAAAIARQKALADKAAAKAAEPQAATAVQDIPELRAHDVKASMAERATSRIQDAREAAKARIKSRSGRLLSGIPADDLADYAIIGASHIAEGAIKFADFSARMIKDFGDEIKPHLQKIFGAAQEQHTTNSVKELLNSLVESKGMNAEQQELYKTQRAERFKNFESAGGEGVDWAKKAMSTLKGEYEKVNPGEGLGLTPHESNALFSTVKQAQISTPEKARGIATLFKLMNGDSNLQTNEIDLLDKIFAKHFGPVSGPGAAMPYDIKSGGKPITFSEAVSKKPDDFLTKLANFSTKATRSVLGFHVPGTAISFHGFNEAIRNTVFGPDFNPFKAAGRFGQAAYYLARPQKAAEFLETNAESLAKAIEEGGLKAHTGDIGQSSMFKGDNILTKGINALTNPKPLFGQVIPALKLKAYNGLLESLEKTGMEHGKAAKTAGYATNNIFGGLNLHELQRSQNTQKLFRAAALAPDWLESNIRLGKGMFDAIKNPKAPEAKVYLAGMANFLGSYVALNVLNAVNNNGRFSFQNEVGHEFDIATGKDSAGRTRYFSPYGTAMDMFRIPLEIAHAAVEGNTGKAFSDMRSRASEPLQFMTDMMTNTDYAGRSLYDKTKYGKHIPALTQGANVAGDAASHFLPIGVESGINLSQGKISPEQFASQVLQAPMKYKTPERPQGSLRLRNMRSLKP
jgi:hypothetical protein